MALTGEEVYARTYDSVPPGWPGEIEAYLRWSHASALGPRSRVLELACGTGRIANVLAAHGCDVDGIDLSPAMLEAARSRGLAGNPRWILADMRDFDLKREFDIAIIPAHSFQFMVSADDQVAALTMVRRHLRPGGRLVVHLDRPGPAWLASLGASPPAPERWQLGKARRDPGTGLDWCMHFAWTLDPATEVATLHLEWIRLDQDGSVVERVPQSSMNLKVIGRAEMEHALARAEFEVQALFGDFSEGPPGPRGDDLGRLEVILLRFDNRIARV